ncbi:MAG: hypothetical protein L6Q76_22935 [Polyangiaceae bacterium]|nr:hypothetical protein [Polyangiaceae bacterium]
MRRRTASILVVGLLAVFSVPLSGCGGRHYPWRTIVRASPDPFYMQRRFAVLPVSYEGLQVGDKAESEYLSEKDGEKWQTWQADKAAISERFTQRLIDRAADVGIQVVRASGPQAAPFFIRPHVTWIEPGFYTAFVNKGSEIKMRVQITDVNGLVLDEIAIHQAVESSGDIISSAISRTVTSGSRLKQAAEALGDITGQYVEYRVLGEVE